MSDFKNITIKDRGIILPYLLKSDYFGCELSFANAILWDVDHQLQYCIWNDVLVYRWKHEEFNFYYTPCTDVDIAEYVEFVEKDAKKQGIPYVIGSLHEEMKERLLSEVGDRYFVEEDRDFADYIYLVEELASLSGKKFHKKKNHLNGFLKEYDFVYEEISAQNRNECLKMKERWFVKRIALMKQQMGQGEPLEDVIASLKVEEKAIEYALEHYDEFGFEGGLIRINGEVEAFTFGEDMGKGLFDTHFEKAMDEYRGLYVAMNQQFAQNTLLGKYQLVNREEDMGLSGLRQAKMTYNPVMIYTKYVAKLK